MKTSARLFLLSAVLVLAAGTSAVAQGPAPGGPARREPPTLNADGTLTLPNGTVVTPNADGSITLPDGHTIPPPSVRNADGSVTPPDGTRPTRRAPLPPRGNADGSKPQPPPVRNADGTLTMPDGTIATPNADGSFTLPDGTVIHPPKGGPGPGHSPGPARPRAGG